MKALKLLPCPFCGCAPEISQLQGTPESIFVGCPRVHNVNGDFVSCSEYSSTIVGWNTRAVVAARK